MDIDDFVFHLLELIAALSGSYYYLKTNDRKVQPFIWFLWVIVIVETVGMYGYILQNNYDNEIFIWIKNSVFCSNTWLYNIFNLSTIFFLGLFFKRILNNDLAKKLIVFMVILIACFTVLYFGFIGNFFKKSLPYDFLMQTLAVFVFVMLYYFELLNSDKILFFYKSPVFYLCTGILLWFLCVSPLSIFDAYMYEINQGFLEFRGLYLLIANILLYSCYTFGFLYPLYVRKQLVTKR
tara:strand:- start:384 stop:1094 length:711 start_codon:yes stop_codon:yes gene_type:complete